MFNENFSEYAEYVDVEYFTSDGFSATVSKKVSNITDLVRVFEAVAKAAGFVFEEVVIRTDDGTEFTAYDL